MVNLQLELNNYLEVYTKNHPEVQKIEEEKVILLVETPEELYRIVEKGVPVENVNIGGMHFRKGKTQIAPFVFVDDDDIIYLKKLIRTWRAIIP